MIIAIILIAVFFWADVGIADNCPDWAQLPSPTVDGRENRPEMGGSDGRNDPIPR